jgi:hypothetical protein
MSPIDLSKLPTLADVQASRVGKPIPKGKSRLQAKTEARPLTRVDEKAFRDTVFKRDKGRCRKCERKVIRTLERVPERAEIHHVHGRVGDLRFEDKCALLLCAQDHELVTGRVNERWSIVPTKTWTNARGEELGDARSLVRFVRIA